MIIVTGAAGFIGSNLVRGLNAAGRSDIIAVDDMTDGTKFRNLVDCDFVEYLDKDDFMSMLRDSRDHLLEDVEIVFHQGACSDTREWNGKYMLENNYTYSVRLLESCIDRKIHFIYASSAAVYGTCRKTGAGREGPLNVYGYSKLLFDRYVAGRLKSGVAKSQIAGLVYFNVYGPRERHKGAQASMVLQLNDQLLANGVVNLFKGSGGYADGEQRRDFIHVDDVVAVNLWFMKHRRVEGIFDVGTGRSRSFNEIARLVINRHGKGRIRYVDFPDDLLPAYQSFTEADISSLRKAGYRAPFVELEEGVGKYLDWLN